MRADRPDTTTVRSSQGVDVAVHDLGGSGPLLVFAHATGLHGLVWIPLAARLAASFHCVSFDFRAHGHSTFPGGADLRWTSLAGDLLAVIDAVSPDTPVRAVGHSMGGAAIALAAHRRPDRFVGAWAFEPILLAASEQHHDPPIAQAAQHRRRSFPDRETALQSYGSRPPLGSLHPDALFWYVEHGFIDEPDGTVRLACEPANEAAVFRNAPCGADAAAVGAGLRYALVAGNDGGPPAQLTRAAAQRAEHLSLIELDLDHFGPLVDPDLVAESIIDWFQVRFPAGRDHGARHLRGDRGS